MGADLTLSRHLGNQFRHPSSPGIEPQTSCVIYTNWCRSLAVGRGLSCVRECAQTGRFVADPRYLSINTVEPRCLDRPAFRARPSS